MNRELKSKFIPCVVDINSTVLKDKSKTCNFGVINLMSRHYFI